MPLNVSPVLPKSPGSTSAASGAAMATSFGSGSRSTQGWRTTEPEPEEPDARIALSTHSANEPRLLLREERLLQLNPAASQATPGTGTGLRLRNS
eukprot:2317132-Alexandrium_andersonii.AAC.1